MFGQSLRKFDLGRGLMGFLQTSLDKTGSDAMNAAGDYSSAYCILSTDSEFSGHGMVSRSAFFLVFGSGWEGFVSVKCS